MRKFILCSLIALSVTGCATSPMIAATHKLGDIVAQGQAALPAASTDDLCALYGILSDAKGSFAAPVKAELIQRHAVRPAMIAMAENDIFSKGMNGCETRIAFGYPQEVSRTQNGEILTYSKAGRFSVILVSDNATEISYK